MRNNLTVNKTKFYKLAQKYCPEIPNMRNTHFEKAYREQYFTLEFYGRNDDIYHYYRLALSVLGDRATLGLKKTTYDDDGNESVGWKAYPLTVQELQEFDLLKDKAAMQNQLKSAKAKAAQHNAEYHTTGLENEHCI